MAQANRDKPHIDSSASLLDKQIGEAIPQPFVYITKANQRIVFPDPYEMGWEEAEEFLAKLEAFGNSRDALLEWVGQDGLDAIRGDKLTLRQMLTLVQNIQTHYTAALGSPGESNGSAGS